MKKLAFPIFALGCAALVIATFWYYRPGSEYAPSEVVRMSNAEDRRAAYRAMEAIYPAVRIERPDVVTTFARDLRDLELSWEWDGAQRTLDDYAAQRRLQGILVLEDRTVVYERYFGDAGPTNTFTSWSVAKSVIGSLIGIALKDGVINGLDDKVASYAPQYQGTDYGDTTIRHLLMMSSGIDFDEDYEVRGSDIRKLFFNTFLLNKDVDGIVRAHERNREPGQDFDYISSNTQVLAAVLRGAYGQPLISIFNDKLARPLGIAGGTWLTDRKGPGRKELGYCCLQLTLEDYAKLGQLYVQDGIVGDLQVLPTGWPDFVGTPPTEDHRPRGEGQLGYGHHFWIIGGDEGALTMQGYDGQYVHMDRDEGVVIVLVSADRSRRDDGSGVPEFVRLFQAIKAELRDGDAAIRSAGGQ